MNPTPFPDDDVDEILEAASAILFGTEPAPPTEITEHACTRWRDRIDRAERHPRYAIRAAWSRSVSVGWPDGATVRILPPANAALVSHGEGHRPKIVTVLRLNRAIRAGRPKMDHLVVCHRCRQLDDPAGGSRCRWCGDSLGTATPVANLPAPVLRVFGPRPPGFEADSPAILFRTPKSEITVVPAHGERDGTLRGWIRTPEGTRETSIPLSVVRALRESPTVTEQRVPSWRTPVWPELDVEAPTHSPRAG